MVSKEEVNEAKNYRVLRNKMQNMWQYVCFMIFLMGALYCSLCIIIWQVAAPMRNGIDDSPGLPLIYDIFLFLSSLIIVVSSIACIKIIRSWIPPKVINSNKKSDWDRKVPDVSMKPTEVPKDMFRSVRSD